MERVIPSTNPSGRGAPKMAVLPHGEDRLPAIHRRAGIAAILRDERLEIAVDEDGAVRVRRVAGACRCPVPYQPGG